MGSQELIARIHELGVRARAEVGPADVRLLKSLKVSCRVAEVVGRVCLNFAVGPWVWLFGLLSLAYQLSVEAQLNHSIQHGAYVGVPGAERFTPSRYESLALPFQARTWRDAHRLHHQHPSVLGEDPDTIHPLFRMHASQRWRPWHFFNSFLGAFFTFEHWAFDYDKFLKRTGNRGPRDRTEVRKFVIHVGYQYVLFPVLAGPHWKQVLAGGVLAAIIRNLIFTGLQTASSVGHEVSTRHALNGSDLRGAERLRFQIETSKNFVLRGVTRILCGGLDRHIEHHLYPHLPPARLYALSADVRAACAEHGIRYQEFPSFNASLRDSATYLHALSGRSAASGSP
jgi:NADPH-dependent stearoyl-CoA 9-desaturase